MNWQAQRSIELNKAFSEFARRTAAGESAIFVRDQLIRRYDGVPLGQGDDPKRLRLSKATFYRQHRIWEEARANRRDSFTALQPKYKGGQNAIPDELKTEIQRLVTSTTGGRNKHGIGLLAYARKDLNRRWTAGEWIPGLGDWRTWWQTQPQTREHPLPPEAPDFPYCDKTLDNHARMAEALRRAGNVGIAAAQNYHKRVSRDYSQLRRCEVYTLDDVRFDFIATDEHGKTVTLEGYFLMEVASRSIVAYTVKARKKTTAQEVDELLAYGLRARGFGIGEGYDTHILFERGDLACSVNAQTILESMFPSIQIHRTGMNGGVRWVGAPTDQASGNAAGKVVVESFFRRLHYELLHLPGQRGNHYSNTPSNLGHFGTNKLYRPDTDEAKEVARNKHTLTAKAERLAQFQNMARDLGYQVPLELPTLTVIQARAAIATAVEKLNHESGHHYQGHGKTIVYEQIPGSGYYAETPVDGAKHRPVTNSPAREYQVRPGRVTPISDHAAALLMSDKRGPVKATQAGVTIVTPSGDRRTYWSETSPLCIQTEKQSITIRYAISPADEDHILCFRMTGEYLETLPAEELAGFLDQDALARETGKTRRAASRAAAHLAQIHHSEGLDTLDRDRRNEAAMGDVLNTISTTSARTGSAIADAPDSPALRDSAEQARQTQQAAQKQQATKALKSSAHSHYDDYDTAPDHAATDDDIIDDLWD